MDFIYGLMQQIGVHTILGLSAYVVLQTGQVTLAQAGFFAIGAYASSILTTLYGWNIVAALFAGGGLALIVAALAGFPALRVKGLMLVVATMAFGEIVRLFFFILNYQVQKGDVRLGPQGAEGFKQIRYFFERGWSTLEVCLFIWAFVIAIMAALWLLDRSRAGSVLRAVGEDELAAQSVGINLTAVKVSAFALGGLIAGIGGGLYAHYTTHIEHAAFGVVLATFAITYPILGGLSNVFGTLLAVLFIQIVIVQGIRWALGDDWRNILFGALIVLAMVLRPSGLLDARTTQIFKRMFSGKGAANA
ncbi:MAG: branched-chain amino acid ABC transporter permease [Alphaproteobacteria bacterium]